MTHKTVYSVVKRQMCPLWHLYLKFIGEHGLVESWEWEIVRNFLGEMFIVDIFQDFSEESAMKTIVKQFATLPVNRN